MSEKRVTLVLLPYLSAWLRGYVAVARGGWTGPRSTVASASSRSGARACSALRARTPLHVIKDRSPHVRKLPSKSHL